MSNILNKFRIAKKKKKHHGSILESCLVSSKNNHLARFHNCLPVHHFLALHCLAIQLNIRSASWWDFIVFSTTHLVFLNFSSWYRRRLWFSTGKGLLAQKIVYKDWGLLGNEAISNAKCHESPRTNKLSLDRIFPCVFFESRVPLHSALSVIQGPGGGKSWPPKCTQFFSPKVCDSPSKLWKQSNHYLLHIPGFQMQTQKLKILWILIFFFFFFCLK